MYDEHQVHFVEHSVGVISCSAYGPNAWMMIEWYSETQSNVKLKTDDDYNIWQVSSSRRIVVYIIKYII